MARWPPATPKMSIHQISTTSQIVIDEIPATFWMIDEEGKRIGTNGIRYSASYKEPSAAIFIVAKGDTEAEARDTLAALLSGSAAAGLI